MSICKCLLDELCTNIHACLFVTVTVTHHSERRQNPCHRDYLILISSLPIDLVLTIGEKCQVKLFFPVCRNMNGAGSLDNVNMLRNERKYTCCLHENVTFVDCVSAAGLFGLRHSFGLFNVTSLSYDIIVESLVLLHRSVYRIIVTAVAQLVGNIISIRVFKLRVRRSDAADADGCTVTSQTKQNERSDWPYFISIVSSLTHVCHLVSRRNRYCRHTMRVR